MTEHVCGSTEKKRFLVFHDNMKKAAKMQSSEKEGSTAKYGATQFADLTGFKLLY